jgi:hypothetical protein
MVMQEGATNMTPAEKIAETLTHSRTMLASPENLSKLSAEQEAAAKAQIARAEKIAEWSKSAPSTYLTACRIETGKGCLMIAIKQFGQ